MAALVVHKVPLGYSSGGPDRFGSRERSEVVRSKKQPKFPPQQQKKIIGDRIGSELARTSRTRQDQPYLLAAATASVLLQGQRAAELCCSLGRDSCRLRCSADVAIAVTKKCKN